MQGLNFGKKEGLNILCLGAHCDDIEIGLGCTLLKLIEEYSIEEIWWVVFTSNPARKSEAETSASWYLERISKKNVIVHSLRDGFLPFTADKVKELFEAIKKDFTPDVIFTHYRNDRHQDHRLVSDLTWNTWRNHFILEYEIPKYDGDIGNPNFYVPITEEILRKRNELLLKAFPTQASKHWFDEQTFSSLPRLRGMESASKFAEAFYARKVILN